MTPPDRRPPAHLVLADGAVFAGEAAGAVPPGGVCTGEVVFNTVMSGYQEVLTDPSYAGQIVAFTYPHIGNYGVNRIDSESRRVFCRGVVVRDLAHRPSSWRAEVGLEEWFRAQGVAAITGIDTRRLTRHIRDAGSMPAAFGTADVDVLLAAAQAEPGTDGLDLVATVTTPEPYTFGTGPLRLVAYDFGIKTSILRLLGERATVEVVPASTPASEVIERGAQGVFLSNGPGDPSPLGYAVRSIRDLLGQVPVFGICLGHQLLGTALGGSTYKLAFGHHGGNHPVRRTGSSAVEITSQNHNYAVTDASVCDAEVTHRNLNDGVVEGLRCTRVPAFSVQYHPEAGPGPHDARYLFDDFYRMIERGS